MIACTNQEITGCHCDSSLTASLVNVNTQEAQDGLMESSIPSDISMIVGGKLNLNENDLQGDDLDQIK